ncbi:MAG: SDR family oxidoreductase [Anaerolineales bacterium]|uniref:SDR family oxidoreductase n=1 Tax=Candidatus Villigracilis proximus TaxID=3140683 RepID=UPI0031349E4C|nr:SDR family oxidoreductase [Anaerolineales bacterium]
MPKIKDKIVVVTGSTRGFGYAIAESFLEAGATVAVTGRSQQAVDAALASLQPKGRVSGFVMDVREEQQVYKLVEDVVKEFGHIDVWVNNAGYSNAGGMMLDMNPQDALDMFMSNDFGLLQCTQAIMHYMLPRKQGLLVNIYGNGSFLRPASPTGLYGATKAWVTSFTRSLATELKDSGIQILGFSPGMMTTDMLTSPIVVGERGKEMLKNFGFVLRFLGQPAKYASDKLVKAVASNRKEFSEIKLFKPWTPLLGLIRVGWENITKTGKTPEFELHYQEAYQSKYLNTKDSK